MPTQEELFSLVDELLQDGPALPSPAERARLREAAGRTQADVAHALRSSVKTVKNWEAGRSEPRPPRLQAYLRLLEGWAAKYPATTQPAPVPAPAPAREPAPDTAPVRTPPPLPTSGPITSRPPTSRPTTPPRPAHETAPAATRAPLDPRFPNGPLAVLDGDGTAYCFGGVVLDCPATTIPALVEWTLTEAGLGAPRLNRNGKESDPLVVLTASAAERFGLPGDLDSFEGRRARRLPEDHKVVKQIARAKWQLTRRGFGPWARVYRPAEGGQRRCVQLAILPWEALEARSWGARPRWTRRSWPGCSASTRPG